ncbi:MAG TPA: flagellar motor protein MotB [Bdellovibrionales bacterium]|nr:flagellar motor protein MotB [Bdellovibrionales bacterium]
MAEKKPQIVIKKITVVAGGAHGGAWKVAFADFMTAMMAFFLVMWLVNQTSPEEKKAISDYFSTPSVIEYQFQNFGAELTLEKLFLDLINEPLKTLESFVTPADRTPNVMHLGTKKIVMAYMAEQLGNMASDVNVTADKVVFEIPDNLLFDRGTPDPIGQFVKVMERVKGVTAGLEDSNIYITSVVFRESVPGGSMVTASNVSEQRLDLIRDKVLGALESDSVAVVAKANARNDDRPVKQRQGSGGFIRFEIRQKTTKPDGSKPKTKYSGGTFGGSDVDNGDYDNFVDAVAKKKR